MHATLLGQDVPALSGTVFDVVAGGLGPLSAALMAYQHATLQLEQETEEEGGLQALEKAHEALDQADGWGAHQRVAETLSQVSLEANVPFASLSGGLKRRALLARALVADPALLLLDEPTNHMDMASIQWLERFLKQEFGGRNPGKALMFISHDRMFLDRMATRILDLDRGRVTDWPGDYATYRRGREVAMEVETAQNALFDKKLAQEEVWIRQGIKARRTRNEGRVRALKQLRRERLARREKLGTVRMQLDVNERSGQQVVKVQGVSYHYEGQTLIRDFSTLIQRGDKVGVMGPNGSGKTTLLRLLLGELAPQTGRVRMGTRLDVAYFDQLRAVLDDNKTVQESVGDGQQEVDFQGKRRHIISYLQDFLFTPDRARSPVRILSGGERNRLLLARLFLKSSNVLVMDEPTNDLDVETLELLEALLVDYSGTLLLVSHDRAFLNHVVTSTLVFEGEGRVGEYVGGYDDWLAQRPEGPAPSSAKPSIPTPAKRPDRVRVKKMSFKEKQELESLPERIEIWETEQATLHATMADPDSYRAQEGGRWTHEEMKATTARLAFLEKTLAQAYERWQALEVLSG